MDNTFIISILNFFDFGLTIVFFYFFFGLAGLWSLRFLPTSKSELWLILFPVIGISSMAIFGGSLSLMGLSAQQYALPTYATLITLSAFSFYWRDEASMRAAAAVLQTHWKPYLCLILIMIAMGSILIGSGGARTSDYWGSADLFDYVSMVQYLQNNGGRYADYLQQDTIISPSVQNQVQYSARIGFVAVPAMVAEILPGMPTVLLINGTILFFSILVCLLGLSLISGVRPLNPFMALLIGCYPFSYFFLSFTYLSQSIALCVSLSSLILFERYLNGLAERALSRHLLWKAIPLIVCWIAIALSYPPACVITGLGGSLLILRHVLGSPTNRIFKLFLASIPAVLAGLMSSFYWEQIFTEIGFIQNNSTLGGWNWNPVPFFREMMGAASVLEYQLPVPSPMVSIAGTIVTGILLIIIVPKGLRLLNSRVIDYFL
ncbi:MAG: hypothetical protein AAFY98_12360 [Verrucomicrobiota bacterium]